MSQDPTNEMTDDGNLLAAEYVLGTLGAVERGEVERRLAADADFRRNVEFWQRRLLPLTSGILPVEPSDVVWPKIVAGIGASRVATQAANDNVVDFLSRSRARWRNATMVVGALAACLAIFVANRDPVRPPAPGGASYVAAVNRGGDLPALLVRVDLATHSVSVRPIEAETPTGKSLELWYVAAGQAPKSLGVIQPGQSARRNVPEGMPLKDTVLAVSVEPPGGSPTGAPTGPVVYKGALIPE